MCLAVPGRVLEIMQEQDLLFARVEFGGISKRVCLDLLPEVRVGDYVLVHVGFALATVDQDEARRMLALLTEMNELKELEAAAE